MKRPVINKEDTQPLLKMQIWIFKILASNPSKLLAKRRNKATLKNSLTLAVPNLVLAKSSMKITTGASILARIKTAFSSNPASQEQFKPISCKYFKKISQK